MKSKLPIAILVVVAAYLVYSFVNLPISLPIPKLRDLVNLPSLPSLPSQQPSQPATLDQELALKVSGRTWDGQTIQFSPVIRRNYAYSIVEAQPSVAVLDFVVTGKNKGQIDLTISKDSASPTIFDNAWSSVITPTLVSPGQTFSFSTLSPCSVDADCGGGRICFNNQCGIPTSSLESLPQPVNFNIKMKGDFTCPSYANKCQTSSGTNISSGQSGIITAGPVSRTLNIYPDGGVLVADFDIELLVGIGESGGCLATGTNCNQDTDCCSLYCQSKTQDSASPIPCTAWYASAGGVTCSIITSNTYMGGTVTYSFTCPSTASRCEFYKVGSGNWNSTTGMCKTMDATPTLLTTCSAGMTCTYRPGTSGNCFHGKQITSTITKSCT